MKKILPILILLVLCSCSKEEKKKEIVSASSVAQEEKVEKRNEVVIAVDDTLKSFFTNLFVDEMQDKPDMLYLGTKEDRISVTIPTDNSIRIAGGNPILSYGYDLTLEKGDSLFIQIDSLNITESKHVAYPIFEISNSQRTWGELNFQYLLYKKNIGNKAIAIDSTKNYLRTDWNREKILDNAVELLDSLKAKQAISEEFYNTTRLNKKIQFASGKIRDAIRANNSINIDDLGLSLNNENQLHNDEYVSYLRTVIRYKHFKNKKRPSNSAQFDFVADNNTFLKENTKLALLDSYLKSIYLVEKSKFDEYLNKFNAINTNEELEGKWRSIASDLKSNQKKLNKPNRNVGVLTNLVNDNELTFDEVLANQKGKVVLVDFWASWCAPCLKEMPYLKELKSDFDENEFQVIQISIDEDYSAWVRASKLENISNEKHSYIIANWEKSNLYKNYKIQAIPRYLLFDKAGKIIDEDAPRPSDKKLEELINANI